MAKSTLFTVRNSESCPKCGAELAIQSGKHGPSLGYLQYPARNYVRSLKSSANGHIVKVLEGQVCLACGANLVLYQGRFGMSIGCSNYPRCEYTKFISKPDETAITCLQCRVDHPAQRRSRYGRTFHSRDRYSECQLATDFKPAAGKCPEYHYPLPIEKRTV